MVKRSPLTFATIAATLLLSTTYIESFTITGILQQTEQIEKCTACIGKLVCKLEYAKGILDKVHHIGAITTKDVTAPTLFDQIAHCPSDLGKSADCKQNCVHFSIYKQMCTNLKELIEREDLRKAYNTVYWYKYSKTELDKLTTGLNNLTLKDRAKYVALIAQDPAFNQCEKMFLSPELKQTLRQNCNLLQSAIKKLNTGKF